MRQILTVNPFNAPVYHEETVSSTMDVSRVLASQGEPHGTVITADFQEKGRGRIRERSWDMERGENLPFTILLRYPRIEDIPPAITLRAGLAVALAVEDFAPVLAGRVRIKWPNDVLIAGEKTKATQSVADARKVAGILAEADGGNVHIGIGVNVAQKVFPPHLQKKATSVSLVADREIESGERFTLLEKILERLQEEIEGVINHGGLLSYGQLGVSRRCPRDCTASSGDFLAKVRRQEPQKWRCYEKGKFALANLAGDGWRERIEGRLYKKGERVCFMQGAADSGEKVTGTISGIGPGGELLIIPDGETEARGFVTGELAGNAS